MVTSTGEWVSSPTWTLYQLSPTLIRSVVTANPCSLVSERGAARGGLKHAKNYLRRGRSGAERTAWLWPSRRQWRRRFHVRYSRDHCCDHFRS